MKIKNIFTSMTLLLVMAITSSTFVSCQSKEESAIAQMERICETIEAEDFDVEDWDKVQKDYDKLSEKILECNFTAEQYKELGRLQGRYAAAAAKHAVNSFGDALNGAVNALDGFMEGLSGE